jgi:hypothetical protein
VLRENTTMQRWSAELSFRSAPDADDPRIVEFRWI